MKKILTFILLSLMVFNSSAALAADGVKTISVFVRDQAGNIQTTPATATIELDQTPPNILMQHDVDPIPTKYPKLVTATVIEDHLKSFKYALIGSGAFCDHTTTFTNNYVSGTDLLFSNETFNGKKVCFKAEDLAGNFVYRQSNVIQNIDTIVPSNPVYSSAYQNSYNTISFSGTCTYEPGLKFVVKDNGMILHEELLSDPCVIDFTYTLSAPPLVHNIEYYLVDPADNRTNVRNFKAYVDNVGYMITPADGVTVTPIISFMGFTSSANATIKIKKSTGEYIATGTADAKGYFILQTPQSQPLGSMQIDLEINGIPRGDTRNINVASSSIVVPTFSNEEAIKRSNTKLITAEIAGQPLSHVKMYSKDASGNRIELGETALDASGNGTIPSTVQLPGGENILYVQDTIYNVSSQILLIVVVDPFGYVYDSVSKEKIPGAKVYVTDCSGSTINLPNVNGQPQTNPVIANSLGYYDSYEIPGTYCLKVEKDGYTWPSTKLPSGTLNLDNTVNVGSHGQPFVVLNSPIHIDVPMDKIPTVVTTSGGGGGSTFNPYDYRSSTSSGKIVTSTEGKKMEISYPSGIKTLTKTYNTGFDVLYIEREGYYRFMYHKSTDDIKEIPFNQNVNVAITDLGYNGQAILYKTAENQEWKLLEGYSVNGKTISFKIDRGFILMIDYNNIYRKPATVSDTQIIEVTPENQEYKKYDVIFYDDVDMFSQIKFSSKLDAQFGNKLLNLDSKVKFIKIPVLLSKIKSKSEPTATQKMIYNYLGGTYNIFYSEYLKTLIVKK